MSTNPDIEASLAALRQASEAIQAAMDQTEDPAVWQPLNDKLPALQLRIAKLEQLAFAQRSQAIAQAAHGVEAAQGELAAALKRINDINHAIATVTALIGTVDKVIAAAGSLGVG